ncbi:hypothetical protein JX580_06345 [Thiomicrospira microaerophila]|uniref:hypothetical protein n=1 Tax=Thiomicrospira microaerophila TaxID=406020 RepID=UPI00200BEB8A|nr:hypothetical protein [Thiomicrospira microaerophila]UQB41319.1 hypothetical protein JX580_06345 [Thiomicrospira microaerophila]
MNPAMIKELAKNIRHAFERHQSIKMPVMRKDEFSFLMKEIRLSEPMISYMARRR